MRDGKVAFDGIERIDWASLHHAYGPAGHMPDVLRGIVSPDRKRRAWAGDYLWGAVHHQGDVYAVTVAAVPFLLAAAADPRAHGRGRIVDLLAGIGGTHAGDDPDTRWTFMRGGPAWTLVETLATLRDERAVPYLAAALSADPRPPHVTYRLARFGPAAAVLLPPVRAAAASSVDDGLLHALVALGAPDEAVEHLLPRLTTRPERSDLWLLTSTGPAAAPALDIVRGLLTHEDPNLAINAADAVYAITGDIEETLQVYDRRRPELRPADFAIALGALGPAAARLAPRLRDLLTAPDAGWVVALALWRITADHTTTLPFFAAALRERRGACTAIPEALTQMGPLAAETEPLLRAESTRADRASFHGSSAAITDDEQFLAAVRTALTAVTTSHPADA